MKGVDGRLQIDYDDVMICDERPLSSRWRAASWLATFNGRRWDVRWKSYRQTEDEYRARAEDWKRSRAANWKRPR